MYTYISNELHDANPYYMYPGKIHSYYGSISN